MIAVRTDHPQDFGLSKNLAYYHIMSCHKMISYYLVHLVALENRNRLASPKIYCSWKRVPAIRIMYTSLTAKQKVRLLSHDALQRACLPYPYIIYPIPPKHVDPHLDFKTTYRISTLKIFLCVHIFGTHMHLIECCIWQHPLLNLNLYLYVYHYVYFQLSHSLVISTRYLSGKWSQAIVGLTISSKKSDVGACWTLYVDRVRQKKESTVPRRCTDKTREEDKGRRVMKTWSIRGSSSDQTEGKKSEVIYKLQRAKVLRLAYTREERLNEHTFFRLYEVHNSSGEVETRL